MILFRSVKLIAYLYLGGGQAGRGSDEIGQPSSYYERQLLSRMHATKRQKTKTKKKTNKKNNY